VLGTKRIAAQLPDAQKRLGIDVQLAAVGAAQRQREVQVREVLDDAGAPDGAERLAGDDVPSRTQLAPDGVEVDVARHHGAVAMGDAHEASGVAAGGRAALDALDDAVGDRDHDLAERRREIDAAVAELALPRPRLRTHGAEAARLERRQRARAVDERMEPAHLDRLGRIGRLVEPPRSVEARRLSGRQLVAAQRRRRREPLEQRAGAGDGAAPYDGAGVAALAEEPVAVTPHLAADAAPTAADDRDDDDQAPGGGGAAAAAERR